MTASLKDAWRTHRLYFRTICEDDYEWMFTEINGDPVNRALANPFPLSPPQRMKPEEWIKNCQGLLDVVICVRSEPRMVPRGREGEEFFESHATNQEEKRIGYLSLHYGGYGSSPLHRACVLGITLAESSQDKGYGTEAIQWALEWAFKHGNLHSVNLSTVSYNTNAHKCYEKCGFKLAGRKRQCVWHDGQWHDALDYDILEAEWKALRQAKS
ncbi:unnamed protein product [Discula destructiva]